MFLETSGRHIHVNALIANRLVTFIFLRVNWALIQTKIKETLLN